MSLTWQPTKSLVARDWQDEEAYYEWAEMTEPPVMERPKALVILAGLAFWFVIGFSVWLGRRMGL